MSEEQQQENQEESANENTSEDQSSGEVENLRQQLEALKNKTNELLDEKKKVQQKAREAEKAAEREKLEKAKESGDYKQLLESSEKERQTLAEQLESLQQGIASERVKSESMKVASDLADGTNAELLSEFIARRIKHTDEGIKVLDSNGNLTVSSIEDLKNEIVSSGKYNSLLRGNKASGGGATGSGSSATHAKQISRADFENKNPKQRMDFIMQGGKVTD